MLFQAMMQDNLNFVGWMFVLMFIFFALFVLATIFWVLMIIDCAKRKMSDNERITWILILVFLGAIGAVVYYFMVKRK